MGGEEQGMGGREGGGGREGRKMKRAREHNCSHFLFRVPATAAFWSSGDSIFLSGATKCSGVPAMPWCIFGGPGQGFLLRGRSRGCRTLGSSSRPQRDQLRQHRLPARRELQEAVVEHQLPGQPQWSGLESAYARSAAISGGVSCAPRLRPHPLPCWSSSQRLVCGFGAHVRARPFLG